MSLKSLFAGAAGKALFISLAGAVSFTALPAASASAATLQELYLADMVIRNCQVPFDEDNTVHDGEDDTYTEETDGETATFSRRRAGRVTRAIEDAVSYYQPDEGDFDAIFEPINQQISADIEQFCIDNIPTATSVMNSL